MVNNALNFTMNKKMPTNIIPFYMESFFFIECIT